MDSTTNNQLFSWVHNKLNGKQANNNCNANIPASNKNQTPQLVAPKEEFSDWPQGILSIGTLFNKSKEDTKDHQEKTPVIDFTLEEVKELQKELSALLSSNDVNCLSSLDAEKLAKITHSSPSSCVEGDDDDHGEASDRVDQHFNGDIVPNKAKEIYMSRKKSFSFLLKKMFVCGLGGGLGPSPSLRDPTISARKTSITKILRAMLRKKIYPQSSCQTMSRSKKYLGNGQMMIESSNFEDDDVSEDEDVSEGEFDDEGNTISKWDKSDTEYIVLEI